MNILSNIDEIANLIIRPSRYTYKSTDLGNKTFKIQQKTIIRQDFQIKNQNNLKIKGSIYSPQQQLTNAKQILIYLHCNSGCRIQGLAYMKMAIQQNFTYIVFDFTGSGISQGKYVSLENNQDITKHQIYNVYIIIQKRILIQQLKQYYGDGLWALLLVNLYLISKYIALNFLLKRKYQISLAIFDSPFRSLYDLFIQIGKQKTNFPDFILDMGYKYLKPIIQQKAKFNIQDIDLKIQNNLISNPGIFIASKNDSLVPFQQIQQIYQFYKGQKQMFFIQEGHNQTRNVKVIKQVFITIRKFINSQENIKKNKKNYITSFIPERKQLSKKKLQLTIKSLSQRQLITGKTFRDNKQEQNQHNLQTNHHRQSIKAIVLQKKQISCLLPHKKSLKAFQVQQEQQKRTINMNKSQSKLKIKKKPFEIKNLFQQKLKSHKNHIRIQGQNQHQLFNEQTQSPRLPLTNRQPALFQQRTNKPSKVLHSQSQISQPHSDIKNENNHININKINFTTNMNNNINFNINNLQNNKIKFNQKFQENYQEKQKWNGKQCQFLKRCQSIQKVFNENHDFVMINQQKKYDKHNEKNHQKNYNQFNQKNLIKPLNIKNKINLYTHTQLLNVNNIMKLNNKNKQNQIDKLQQDPNLTPSNQSSNTYREIKCTQRVLQKIIQKQQKKQLTLNIKKVPSHSSSTVHMPLQNIQNYTLNIKKQPYSINLTQINNNINKNHMESVNSNHNYHNMNIHINNQNKPPGVQDKSSKQRKTFQHIVNKKPPFVQLKGVKNYRNSFQTKQTKFKTELRK